MQKIFIDTNLLEDYVEIEKHISSDNNHIIDIQFKYTTCISFLSNSSVIFTSDDLCINVIKNEFVLSCSGGESINLKLLIKEKNIYIIDTTDDVKNNGVEFEHSKSVSIVSGSAYIDPDNKYKFVPLYDEYDKKD